MPDRGGADHMELVGLAEITDAAALLEHVAVRTPLVLVPRLQPGLLIKPELLQPTGSFKLRGAYVAIRASGEAARQHGVVAHSSGNHGLAVAYAAALLGVRAAVVVPRTAPRSRPRRSSGTAPSWCWSSPRWPPGPPPPRSSWPGMVT